MADVLRCSLTRMYMAVNPKGNQTPEPFCELRAFIFINGVPTSVQKGRLKGILNEELNKLEDIIESVGEQKRDGSIAEWTDPNVKPDAELRNPTQISVKMPTRNVKVMIEGLEVEAVSLQDIFQTGQFRYFSDTTVRTIAESRDKFLNLLIGKPQRYFALIRGDGSRFEYDEADIKGRLVPLQIENRRIVEARADLIKGLSDWREKADFQKSLYDIMRIVERQRELRKG